MESKTKILVILLFVLAGTLTYRLLHPYEPQRVEKLTYTRQKKAPIQTQQAGTAANAGSMVMLELLEQTPPVSENVARNLFFVAKPRPEPAPGIPETATDAGQPTGAPANAPPVPPKGPWEKLQEDLGGFQFFGFYEQGDRLCIFLKHGKQVLAVGPGDLLAGRYRITAVDHQTLTIQTGEIGTPPVQIDLEQLFTDRSLDFNP